MFVMKDKNAIAYFVRTRRKDAGLTQREFAARSGLGLRFVRELEQGKESLRMDKVNQALLMFASELGVHALSDARRMQREARLAQQEDDCQAEDEEGNLR